MCCVSGRDDEKMAGNELRKIIGHRRTSASTLIKMRINWSFGWRTNMIQLVLWKDHSSSCGKAEFQKS